MSDFGKKAANDRLSKKSQSGASDEPEPATRNKHKAKLGFQMKEKQMEFDLLPYL